MYNTQFYFRAREQNANIYRISADNRKSRDLYDHIGTITYQSGKIKLQDDASISPDEEKEIMEWVTRHKARMNKIQKSKIEELIVDINHAAHWVQTNASDNDIHRVFEDLVLALQDLRQVSVRRYAKALENGVSEPEKNKK